MQSAASTAPSSINFTRIFTANVRPFDSVEWTTRDAVIVGADGTEKFRQDGVEVPAWWPENTVNIVVEKYFRVVDGKKETSAKQMFHRVARWVTLNGVKQGVFQPGDLDTDTETPANIFYDELLYLLVNGMYAFNSPVWFNAGAITDPQCSACFIQSAGDRMTDIMDLAKREVMLFKGGSGTGSNLSKLRSSYEKLSRGGRASGPVSFMEGYDAFAGVTKSGGTTRRAAKMVVLNVDHPDLLEQHNGKPGFVRCKADAEDTAQALYSTGKFTAEWNKPGNVYEKVGFQNANNSVRVTDEFMKQVENDGPWETKAVKSGKVIHTYKATDIWKEIALGTWKCGDPGIQFDTATNEWHTCKASGRINASNPCSEYVFLDDTACNLGSLNLVKFAKGRQFMVDEFVHATRIAITSKEIIVDASSYPSEDIARNSHKYRTLGLGYTNLGALLTLWGLPYDSNDGRSVAAAITSLMGGAAYEMSAELAAALGPFQGFGDTDGRMSNRDHMLDVIKKHWEASKRIPVFIKEWRELFDIQFQVWRDALVKGEKHGYRNAQVTVIAPTGTISFLMGADTTGIEPMLGCVVYKKVVGEGLMKMPSKVVKPALENLGYDQETVTAILGHISKTGAIDDAPGLDPRHRPVFAEALGPMAIKPEAHVEMMIAVQPFISGAISKTVNMPSTATPEDIANIYMRAWKGGLKCIAIFRDGCKLSQPVSTKLTDASKDKRLAWGERKRLPATRSSLCHQFAVGGQDGYLHIGVDKDGELREIFLRISKAGSTLHGFLDSWAISISLCLQLGLPLEDLAEKFIDTSFSPSGFTSHEKIRFAKSIPDYIFQYLNLVFVEKDPQERDKLFGAASGVVSAPMAKDDSKPKKLDGPPCTYCGNMTFRAGSCYCCASCGRTTGCS